MMKSRKVWYRSRTIWFNAVAASLIALEASGNYLQPVLGERLYPAAMLGIILINVWLRIVTAGGISARKETEPGQ